MGWESGLIRNSHDLWAANRPLRLQDQLESLRVFLQIYSVPAGTAQNGIEFTQVWGFA